MSNYNLGPALDFVINIENSDLNKIINIEDTDSKNSSNHSKTIEINKFSGTAPQFYETVTPMGLTNTFEENVLKAPDSCTLPSPPVDRPSKRTVTNVDSRIDANITLEILHQRVQNLVLKIDNMEQHLKDDIR